MPLDPREGRPRRRAQAAVRATQPHCHLCGHTIDPRRCAQRDPLGSTIDEIIPLSAGGSALDPTNLRHAHRCCNSTRGRAPITPEVRAQCLTAYRRHTLPTTSRVW